MQGRDGYEFDQVDCASAGAAGEVGERSEGRNRDIGRRVEEGAGGGAGNDGTGKRGSFRLGKEAGGDSEGGGGSGEGGGRGQGGKGFSTQRLQRGQGRKRKETGLRHGTKEKK